MISLTALLVIIYFSSLVSSSPFILFPDEIEQMREEAGKTYESWINKCTERDEMPFFNRLLKTYECYPLLSQGPCDPGSWLILDKNQPNKAICTEELCTPEYDIDHVFYNAKCQDNHDLSICPPHQELLTNAFGEGECYCMEGFLPYIEKKESLECYPLLSQGPCETGSWFILDKNQPNKAICAEELCTTDNIHHVFYNGKCQDSHEIDMCGPRKELLTNDFGEGECYCMEGFLPYIEKNESVSCYQEFLQGPCDQGQQYTFPDEDTQDFEEPVCVPTDCKSNEILYEDQCIPVPTCKDPLDYVKFENSTMVPNTIEAVKFEDSTMVPNTIEAKCGRIGFEIGTRGNLISGQVRCAEGKRKDARGRCKKGVGSKRRNKKRRQAITYGRGRNVRNVCCKG